MPAEDLVSRDAQRAGGLSRETMTRFLRNGFLSAWLPDERKAAYLERFDRFRASFGAVPNGRC